MTVKQQMQADVTDSLKQGNHSAAEVLRMAIAAMNTKEKEKRYAISKQESGIGEDELEKKSVLTDEEAMDAVISEIKKRKDAIALYEQGGRPELAKKESEEIALLQRYLPEPMSSEELKALVEASVKAVGAKQMKDMGRVMADLAPKVKGRADGAAVSKAVKEQLNS